MWRELGRAMRTAVAVETWGAPLCAVASHLDYGATLVLLADCAVGAMTGQLHQHAWWIIAPSMN